MDWVIFLQFLLTGASLTFLYFKHKEQVILNEKLKKLLYLADKNKIFIADITTTNKKTRINRITNRINSYYIFKIIESISSFYTTESPNYIKDNKSCILYFLAYLERHNLSNYISSNILIVTLGIVNIIKSFNPHLNIPNNTSLDSEVDQDEVDQDEVQDVEPELYQEVDPKITKSKSSKSNGKSDGSSKSRSNSSSSSSSSKSKSDSKSASRSNRSSSSKSKSDDQTCECTSCQDEHTIDSDIDSTSSEEPDDILDTSLELHPFPEAVNFYRNTKIAVQKNRDLIYSMIINHNRKKEETRIKYIRGIISRDTQENSFYNFLENPIIPLDGKNNTELAESNSNLVLDLIVEPVVEESIINPIIEQVEETNQVEQVVEESIVDPVDNQVEQVVEESIVNPIEESIVNPIVDPIVEPVVEESIVNPIVEPVVEESIVNPIVEPVDNQVVEEKIEEYNVDPIVQLSLGLELKNNHLNSENYDLFPITKVNDKLVNDTIKKVRKNKKKD